MAASMRRVCKTCFQRKFYRTLFKTNPCVVVPDKGYKRWVPKIDNMLYNRRLAAGPEVERHRSEWINWNYDAEVYAFGKRLGEEFEEGTLRRALTHRSYIEKEEERRRELGIDLDAAPLGLSDNQELAAIGAESMSVYIKAYLRHVYPRLFEEGVSAIHDHLISTEVLSKIASHIGLTDLILCQEFPVGAGTQSDTLQAVIGALEHGQGRDRAHLFVRDFVLPQLIETDMAELWTVPNPMGLLTDILAREGRPPPEPRLQWSSASQTVMSLYYVGIYCDGQLLGQSPGETLTIAEEMAARDAVKNQLGLADSRSPLPLGSLANTLQLDFDRVNPCVADLTALEASSM
ncbi:39S ribosomal protein L44, mitochondrial-like [Haliotis rufescens]|uniref:39S ribosomal protein L44, mitochondrial-like n=1 Tax=Haliotis rufescens TaxID=6454 RepID=UPI00201F20D4|nr:39S ribosomal protein L44, mitochondrial-like [Haliotis rufescens]